MLATLRILTRQIPRANSLRRISTDIQVPSPSGSQAKVVDPESSESTELLSTNAPSQSEQQLGSNSHIASASPPSLPSSEAQAHPYAGAKEYAENQAKPLPSQSNLPALPHSTTSDTSHSRSYATPPFNTHHFFSELEKTFPTSTAQSLMRATRALLVDRIGRVRRDALTSKDLENQAYLFRAALSEARNEITLRQRNESAAIRSSLAALRREVDSLDNRMKSDIANLKHELQMDVDNRKTESKTDLKQMDITIEDVLNKAIVSIGAMKASTEEMKWENMRRSVLALGAFALTIVVTFEFSHKPKPPPSPRLPEKKQNEVLDGLDQQMMT